jgi:hypothetical protein
MNRMSADGVPYTQNSSGFEFSIFAACYREKAKPVCAAYCKAEPGGPQCRR